MPIPLMKRSAVVAKTGRSEIDVIVVNPTFRLVAANYLATNAVHYPHAHTEDERLRIDLCRHVEPLIVVTD